MSSKLLEIAEVFGWSSEDIKFEKLIHYYRSMIKEDQQNIDASRFYLSYFSTQTVVMRYFVDLLYEANDYENMNQKYIIVDIDGHIAHESILSLARYWARIKSRLDNDTVFMDAFKSKINKYQFCTLC